MVKTLKPRVDRITVKWEEDDTAPNALSCVATAEVSYPMNDAGDRRIEWFTSGGLYGIELDGPNDPYRFEVERQQNADLIDHLAHFGILYPEVD